MNEQTKTNSIISWGQLFILVGTLILFLFALTARVSFEKVIPPTPIIDYVFEGSSIRSYSGSEENLIIPTSYSIGEVKEYESGVITFQYQWQAWDFWQEHYAVGAEGYYDFYSEIYTHTYPWTYEYNIGIPTYITGSDIVLTTTDWGAFENNTSIKNLFIPKSMKTLGVMAFKNCTNLTEVVFEEGNEVVSDSCFWGCSNLRKVTFPKSLKRIDAYAFFSSGIESITLPANLANMHIGTFFRCSNLKTVKIESTQIRANHSDVYPHFGECNSLETIYVPNTALNYYKTTSPWSYEANKIIGF